MSPTRIGLIYFKNNGLDCSLNTESLLKQDQKLSRPCHVSKLCELLTLLPEIWGKPGILNPISSPGVGAIVFNSNQRIKKDVSTLSMLVRAFCLSLVVGVSAGHVRADSEVYSPAAYAAAEDVVQAILDGGGGLPSSFDLEMIAETGGYIEVIEGTRFDYYSGESSSYSYSPFSQFDGPGLTSVPFETFQILAVRAVPLSGFEFDGWDGACAGIANETECIFIFDTVPPAPEAFQRANFRLDPDAINDVFNVQFTPASPAGLEGG